MLMKKPLYKTKSESDNGGRRISGEDRRIYEYTEYIPERRKGNDRRSGTDRRKRP